MTIQITGYNPNLRQDSLELMENPQGEPTGAEPATEPGAEAMPCLTPDALLVYCQTRLGGLDSEIAQRMESQQEMNEDQKDLSPIQSLLATYADGCHDTASVQKLVGAIKQAYSTIQSRDPGSPALSTLQDMLSGIQTGETTPNPIAQQMIKQAQGMGITITLPDALSAGQIKGLTDTLGNLTSNENSSAELNMINLQSLMSQRQTAVELTTNMMQTLDDTAGKIVSNVGR